MFPDDSHSRSPDVLDNLLKSSFLQYFQGLPEPLSIKSQLVLANDFSKHSKLSVAHYHFNEQIVVEAHGLDSLQSVTLFIGKCIINEVRHGRISQARKPGQPDRVVEHVLAEICEL